MKLNPTKCAFGVLPRQFLGHVVSRRGIEASPNQVKNILGAERPKTMKEVQSLVGKIVALGRFIAKISNKCKPLLESIKKTKEIKWGEE